MKYILLVSAIVLVIFLSAHRQTEDELVCVNEVEIDDEVITQEETTEKKEVSSIPRNENPILFICDFIDSLRKNPRFEIEPDLMKYIIVKLHMNEIEFREWVRKDHNEFSDWYYRDLLAKYFGLYEEW